MLIRNWLNPENPYAFSGTNKIHHYLKGSRSINDISDSLAKISTYTLHKEKKSVKKFNPFFIYSKHAQWQLDLCFMPNYPENKGQKYLFCLIECFSRKLFIRIIEKKDQNTVLNAFKSIQKEIISKPKQICVDKGSEFKNRKFITYCKEKNINLIFAYGQSKAAIVERSQLSLQMILYKIMEERQRRDIFRLVEEALNIYNNRVNRTTGFSPNDAYKDENEAQVLENLEKYYSSKISKKKTPKFKIGQTVRISLEKKVFDRGYHPKFTEEVFRIKKVLTNLPQPRYIVETTDGKETIKGTFYENEMTLANHSTFKIERIVKTRRIRGREQFFVKWVGYPDSRNSWVDGDQVKKYQNE